MSNSKQERNECDEVVDFGAWFVLLIIGGIVLVAAMWQAGL